MQMRRSTMRRVQQGLAFTAAVALCLAARLGTNGRSDEGPHAHARTSPYYAHLVRAALALSCLALAALYCYRRQGPKP